MMALPEDMIGAIKIKDGLFIGDEFAAQVISLYYITKNFLTCSLGSRIRSSKQGDSHYKLCSKVGTESLGGYRSSLSVFPLARLRKLSLV